MAIVPRTSSSPAESELAALVSDAVGWKVTPRQLEGWRGAELLLRLPRRYHGRGRGSDSLVTPELVEQAARVAEAVRETRTLPEATLLLFARGHDVPEHRVRGAYISMLDSVVTEVETVRRPDDEDEFDVLDRFARKLARRSAGSGAARARERLRARGVNVSLADVNYAALAAAFTGEPPTRESVERVAVATGIDAMIRETLASAGPVVQELDIDVVLEMLAVSDIPTLRRRCEDLPWTELCEARDFAVLLVEFARAFLQPASHQGAPEALGLKELALHSDLMTAICALLVVPWFSKYPERVDEWRTEIFPETDRYRAVSSWLTAVAAEVHAELPIVTPAFLDQLEPELREQVHTASRRWALEHSELAEALDDAGKPSAPR